MHNLKLVGPLSLLLSFIYLFSLLNVGLAGDGENPFTPRAYLIRYWKKEISNESPKPSFLLNKVSPLNAVESATFSKLAAQNSLSTHLPSFCSSAGLLCFPDLSPSLEKHQGNVKFASYSNKNFTNYGTSRLGGFDSFKNYSDGINLPVDSFRRYSRSSVGHGDKFDNYAPDSNVADQSFHTYGTTATGGTGRNQSREQFWSRITADYHLNPTFMNQPRPQRSLQTRMSIILSAISKLRGCIRQIENLNPSGASEQDILIQAKMLLAQDPNYKKGFKFDHVWPILKDIEKFSNNNANATRFQQQSANSVSPQPDSPSFESPTSASPGLSSFNLNMNDEEIGVASNERPIGVKKAKAKRKSDENINTIIQQNRNIIELMKKNALDRARASEAKEENKILLRDLNSISNPELREFLQNEQIRIMQKRTQAQSSQHGEHGEGSQYRGSQEEGSQDQVQGSENPSDDFAQYYYRDLPDY